MTSKPFPGRDWNSHPAYVSPDYRSSRLRAPSKPLQQLPDTPELHAGPHFDGNAVRQLDNDLLKNGAHDGEPLGQRIVVTGRVLDQHGQPVPDTLIEIWQANAAGRYIDRNDDNDAPLDPNFLGAGRAATDAQGRYRFYTVKPGAYPWGNHHNAWRPNHIHLSVFGPSIATRLVTQMYFAGDPLLEFDPIYLAVPAAARHRLVAEYSPDVTESGFALGYIFDIVLGGAGKTPAQT
ncbi:MAG: protocatechuate 3,4-dioxygenase subunit beta [Gammaproteobacteria bacterium]|nr:protocatechuate 3,4-dioxygenase subunit beta [Gammaproteobacteria bacterium]